MSKLFEFNFSSISDFSWSERTGETKLWQEMNFGKPNSHNKFLILGINEDFGPQLNFGNAGAKNGFKTTIEKLGNQASNSFLYGGPLCVLGTIEQTQAFKSQYLQSNCLEELDELVESILMKYLHHDHHLIVVGGGHNNALPIIRSICKIHDSKIDVLNIDPHADCRADKYRHSGNPFSFAARENLINDYYVFGLHENYNNQEILTFLAERNFGFSTFEDFIDSPVIAISELQSKLTTFSNLCGLELDVDSIKDFPSSAFTPSGFSIEEVRAITRQYAKSKKPRYFHLPESAPQTESEEIWVGKALAYLINDYIKSIISK